MFRSTTIVRKHLLHLTEVTFVLKHAIKLCRYILRGDVAARNI